jgi:hypothetical protein
VAAAPVPSTSFYCLYSATLDDFRVPIIWAPRFLPPHVISDLLFIVARPFFDEGKGRMLCALCIGTSVADSSGRRRRFRPSLHTRFGFIKHYQSRHMRERDQPQADTLRSDEACSLYNLCVGYF